MNKTKLLLRTSRSYIAYSLLITVVLAPVFYYFTNRIHLTDVEETLVMRRNEFLSYYLPTFSVTDIEAWNAFNRDVKIEKGGLVQKDSIFHAHYYDKLSDENEPYLAFYSPLIIEGKGYTYFTRIDLVETPDMVMNFVWLSLLMMVLLLVGLFVITRLLSQKLWKPFYVVLNKMEAFEIDKSIQAQFPQSNIDEFDRLSKSVNALIDKNTLIYRSQKEFIENAAHEFQTPLAVFKAKVDTLVNRHDITEGQAKELSSLSHNILRLERLNKNLLLLSKIDNDVFVKKDEFVVNELMAKNIDFFTEQAVSKNIRVKIELDTVVKINANYDLLEILLHNLFMNAIRHNIKNGEIRVSTSTNLIRFSNTGQNTALDEKQLFKRFSKNNPASKGTGLGLSIVKRIADLNAWDVQYDFSDGRHSFLVRF